MKNHEKYIINLMQNSEIKPEHIIHYHKQQIEWLQHERLVHLLVMLFTIFLLICASTILYILASLPITILWFLLLILNIFYILHYYRLENTVQKWYKIANQLEKKIQGVGTNTFEI